MPTGILTLLLFVATSTSAIFPGRFLQFFLYILWMFAMLFVGAHAAFVWSACGAVFPFAMLFQEENRASLALCAQQALLWVVVMTWPIETLLASKWALANPVFCFGLLVVVLFCIGRKLAALLSQHMGQRRWTVMTGIQLHFFAAGAYLVHSAWPYELGFVSAASLLISCLVVGCACMCAPLYKLHSF
jgi:hypothetical protein